MRGKTLSPRLITSANLVHLTRGMFLCVRRQFLSRSMEEILGFQVDFSKTFKEHSERRWKKECGSFSVSFRNSSRVPHFWNRGSRYEELLKSLVRAEFQRGKFYMWSEICSLMGKTWVARHINRGRYLPLMREAFMSVWRHILEGSAVKIPHFQMAMSILSHSERKVAVRRRFAHFTISFLLPSFQKAKGIYIIARICDLRGKSDLPNVISRGASVRLIVALFLCVWRAFLRWCPVKFPPLIRNLLMMQLFFQQQKLL